VQQFLRSLFDWLNAPVAGPLLDAYPNARAAYSLRKLRDNYAGPAIRVRRSSDDAEQDIGFNAEGWVDATAISNFVGSGDGFVTTWYAQVDGTPDMVQSDPARQPRIAQGGVVDTDEAGYTALFMKPDHYMEASGFNPVLPLDDYIMWGVIKPTVNIENGDIASVFAIGTLNNKHWETASYRFSQSFVNQSGGAELGGSTGFPFETRGIVMMRNTGTVADLWFRFKKYDSATDGIAGDNSKAEVSIGRGSGLGEGFEGFMGEFVVYPSGSESQLLNYYRNVGPAWDAGPAQWHEGALLPQWDQWHVDLYDWLETLTVEDLTLPDGTLTYDNSYADEDELADIWLKTRHLTASSVTRREADWYLLDNGNGKGIEATGVVRANHNPMGNEQYEGNPPRSWQNEPAYWYQLDLPLSGGGQGNPYYQNPAMGRRAMVVAMVDLMMHHNALPGGSGWYDMVGKAFLGMAEAYRWAGDVLPASAQDAFEKGMERIINHQIAQGPRGINTNMDMFALKGAAELYMATDNAALKAKCVEMVKAALFGYTDGALDTKHKVFAAHDNDGGVFDPSGFIMEGDQAEVFYGGESIYQLMGALQAVTDRDTGTVPADWTFLEEVVRRLQEWRTYQQFHDPRRNAAGTDNSLPLPTAGAGMSGRTSHGVPFAQANEIWMTFSMADAFVNDAYLAGGPQGSKLKSVADMETEIADALSAKNNEFSTVFGGDDPRQWSGWSPWTKKTPYLPPKGWYSRLKSMETTNDPNFESWPALRSGETWNKTFGGNGAETTFGKPIGDEYWSYKGTDTNGNAFGFFVEAQAYQGSYGGWYGGKIETFWTESTGVLLLTRKGKSGCDRSSVDDYTGLEDSKCWFNLDEKAGHHVWGRDENGNGFSTLRLIGRDINRTTTFDTGGTPPTVSVNNVFNDPNLQGGGGQETGSEIEGVFEVENTFELQGDGLKVTHALTSDQTDQVTELWASLPVYLRHNNPHSPGGDKQSGMADTSIEYWDGAAWVSMPEDTDSDGVPEIVNTTALRLGRDYGDGTGPRYGYVSFPSSQDLRLSKHVYYDPYQSSTSARTVHIDLHGNPGTAQALPASQSVSYTIQTTDPTV
jgi:hypothetical protein